jgi:hypothetical protein
MEVQVQIYCIRGIADQRICERMKSTRSVTYYCISCMIGYVPVGPIYGTLSLDYIVYVRTC